METVIICLFGTQILVHFCFCADIPANAAVRIGLSQRGDFSHKSECALKHTRTHIILSGQILISSVEHYMLMIVRTAIV